MCLERYQMKIALINNGCPKNLVDSELMLGILAQKGYKITLNEQEADIVIVNTCSFIQDAETESIDAILEMVNAKKKVIVTGCLPQNHKQELKEAIGDNPAMKKYIDGLCKILKDASNPNNMGCHP